MLRLDQDSAGGHDCANGLEARCAHRLAALDEIHNAVCDSKRARSLDTAANVLDVGFELRILGVAVGCAGLLSLEPPEVLLGQVCEGSNDVLANQVLGLLQVALLGHLDLERAFSKVQVEDLDYAGCSCGRHGAFVLLDLVAASDAQVDAALADEGGDVSGGQEDEREREVLDQRNVQARVAVELDVGAVEEVEADLVEAALCHNR